MASVTETFTAAAHAASPLLRAGGLRRSVVSILNTEALICFDLDVVEHARRKDAGLGAISSPDMLELLLALPVALPVPVESLTRGEQESLRRAPRGAVQVVDGEVTRQAVVPVAVEFALVAARSWRSGLVTAGRFAPFCARAVVLSTRPRDLGEMALEAGFYGVGVIVVDNDGADVLVDPAPFERHRFTAAGWRFLEDVYRLVR